MTEIKTIKVKVCEGQRLLVSKDADAKTTEHIEGGGDAEVSQVDFDRLEAAGVVKKAGR